MLNFFGFTSAMAPLLIYIQWHNMTKFGIYMKIIAVLAIFVGIGHLYLDAMQKKENNGRKTPRA